MGCNRAGAAALVTLLFVCAACSGAAQSDLFGPTAADGGATIDPTGSSPGRNGPGETDGSIGQEDAAGNDSGAVPPSDGSVTDAAATDAAPEDSGEGADVVAPPPALGISCGSAECPVKAEVCCETTSNNHPATFACSAPDQCGGTRELAIPCDDTTDCAALGSPGKVCCATYAFDPLTQSQRVDNVACLPAMQCSSQGNMVALCSKGDPSCPSGKSCKSNQMLFPGYSVCM